MQISLSQCTAQLLAPSVFVTSRRCTNMALVSDFVRCAV